MFNFENTNFRKKSMVGIHTGGGGFEVSTIASYFRKLEPGIQDPVRTERRKIRIL